MKKIVLTYGLIAGVIVAAMVLYTAYMHSTSDRMGSMWLGYASMLIAFSLIFVGIKTFRDKYNSGMISFGKAFKLGLLIALVASSIYVIVWLICYYFFIPDFMEKYTRQMINQSKAAGATAAELSKLNEQMDGYIKMYKNPLFVILLTYAEIFPVGLIVSLISALILKRKQPQVQPA